MTRDPSAVIGTLFGAAIIWWALVGAGDAIRDRRGRRNRNERPSLIIVARRTTCGARPSPRVGLDQR